MDSLLEVLRGVTLDPGEQAAFSADPQGYLAQHGYEGVPDEDVAEAFGLVADTLPADVASANPPPMDALDTTAAEAEFGQGVDDLSSEAEADPMGDLAFGEGSAGYAEFDADADVDAAADFDTDFGASSGIESDESADDFDQNDFDSDDFGASGFGEPSFETADDEFGSDSFGDSDFDADSGDLDPGDDAFADVDDIGSF